MTQPTPFAAVAQQDLNDREGDQLGVGDLGGEPDLGALWEPFGVGLEQVIDLDVQWSDEVVEGGVHEAFSKVDDAQRAPSSAAAACSRNHAYAFHFKIWDASHNRTLIEALESVHLRVRSLASTTLHYEQRWETFVAESVEILDAIRSQDAQRAGQVAEKQMINARDFRVKLYSEGVEENGEQFV